LTWTGKNTAELDTVEVCPSWRCPEPGKMCIPSPQAHHKIVHVTHGGAVKMSPNPDYPVMWPMLPGMTGCDLNGTFPIYHGHFDGDHFYAAAHYNSICDGGTGWINFGISEEDGPIHVTYEFSLDRVD